MLVFQTSVAHSISVLPLIAIANITTTSFSSCFSRWTWISRFPFDSSPPPFPAENLWGLVEFGFYGSDVLPVSQPSVSKHWGKHKALTLTSDLALSFLHPFSTRLLTEGALLLVSWFQLPCNSGSEWMSSFLMARQHIIGYSVPQMVDSKRTST